MTAKSNSRIVGVLASAIALAGCAGSGAPAPTPHATPAPMPTPTAADVPTPTSPRSPAAPAVGDAGSGTLTMVFPDDADVAEAEGTECFLATGEVRVADPRVAGEYRSIICWGVGEGTFSGVWTAWNAGGTWHGPFHGTIDAVQNHALDGAMTGAGDYAGFGLRTHHAAGADDSTWDFDYEVTEGELPHASLGMGQGQGEIGVTGTRSCGTTVIDPIETTAGGGTRSRGGVDLCTWAVSDDRLSGPGLVHVSLDSRPDGSAVGWGSLAQHVGDGLWLGWHTLERAADGTTTVSTSLTGFDAFDGLLYQDAQTGTGDSLEVNGWIAGPD